MAGADTPQGDGWWVASDGKWYPPDKAPGQASPAGPPSSGERGFFARLFDTTFKTFVTPSIVRVLFVLAVILISLFSLLLLGSGLANRDDGGLVLVVLAPLYWILSIIWVRVLIEVVMVLFRIEANTRRQPSD